MSDVEKGLSKVESSYSTENGVAQPQSRGFWGDFVDGFKPVSLDKVDTTGMSQAEIAAVLTANQPLKRSLKGRHIQMIAIGGSIGTGLFIGSGSSFASGGPGSVILAYIVIGIMLFCMMQCLGELAVRFPVSGSFSAYSTRFLDPSWGFAMGWNYALQWLVVFPLELVSATLVIGYWNSDNNGATNVSKAAWCALFYSVIVFINIFGVKGYGEAEFLFSIIKVAGVVGFCIFGIVAAAGGVGPGHHYYGAHYWHDPGAFHSGFKGFVSVFVNAAFAFSGTELSGLAAAESSNPAKTLPRATKQVFWRVLLFYVVSLIICSMLIPYTDDRLGQHSDGRSSPFVLSISDVGVKALPSIMNSVIIIAVLSVANSSVYGCSRTLCALASYGQAPKWLGYVDRQGRPLMAVLVTIIFGLLCFVSASDKEADVFDWLLAFSGLSSLFTWGSVCLALIRFRAGMKAQGRNLDELSFKAMGGLPAAWLGFGINIVIICLEFWVAVWPLGADPSAVNFFQVYLSVPVVLLFYIVHKIYYRTPMFIRAKDMDLDTGMRNLNREQVIAENAEEKAYIASRNIFYRVYRMWC